MSTDVQSSPETSAGWAAEARNTCLAVIEESAFLKNETYNSTRAMEWSRELSANCLAALRQLDCASTFKIIVHTTFLGKSKEASFTSSSACLWDASADFTANVRWENPTMTCIVTVYAVRV